MSALSKPESLVTFASTEEPDRMISAPPIVDNSLMVNTCKFALVSKNIIQPRVSA